MPSAGATPKGTSEREWQVTAFGDPGKVGFAYDVVRASAGFVAVGVQFSGRLPNLGPSPPHEGRIWLSADGISWQDTTPSEIFTNVSLDELFVRADGTLVVLGWISAPTEFEPPTRGAWESTDGRAWQSAATGVPAGAVIVEHGDKGYLALVRPSVAAHESELWHSADGRTWELVRQLMDGAYATGAGDEGFVVVGSVGPPDQSTWESFGIASADGREWFESSRPPPSAIRLASLGGDWIAISYAFGLGPLPSESQIWFSADGLDWAPHGDINLEQVPIPGSICTEYPSGLNSAGGWLVMGSTLSYPCSEGGYVVYGTQQISDDGESWVPVPFESAIVGVSGSGSHVNAAADDDDSLVLVGQMNNQAAFWSRALR